MFVLCSGVLQPVRELVKAVREFEASTERRQRIFIHTDAAQVRPFPTNSTITIAATFREKNSFKSPGFSSKVKKGNKTCRQVTSCSDGSLHNL